MRTLLLVALAAAPSLAQEAQPRLKLAVPDVGVSGLTADRVSFFTEHLAARLSVAGAEVTTAKAIAQVLGAERQKQLFGCSENQNACMAELAAAMGTDGIVSAEVAKFDDVFQVNVKLLSSSGKTLFTDQARAKNAEALLDAIDGLARLLAEAGARATQRALVPLEGAKPGVSLSTLAFIPLGLGVAAEAAGIVLLVLASSAAAEIPVAGSAIVSYQSAQAAAERGRSLQTAGVALMVAGGVAVAVGVVLFVLGLDGKKQPAVGALWLPGQGGALTAGFSF